MSDVTGTSSNDNLNGGSGDDTMDGGAGNDIMSGGSGSDTIDGGSGSDRLNGGSGVDTLIYTLAENAGATDIYTGGAGIDTIRLELTSAEWLRADVQTQIALYLQHLNAVKMNLNTGEVSNGSASDFTFVFDGSARLIVQMMERLDVWVDGQQFDFHAPFVTAADGAGAVTEDVGVSAGNLNDSGTINFLDVDWTQSHTATVTAGGSNTLGGSLTAVVSNVATGDGSGVVTWNYSVANSVTQHLGVGDTATETFTVTITDSAGLTDTQTITVTVTGNNDAPVLTVDASGGVTEDTANLTLMDSGTLSFTDVDVNDSHTVSYAYNNDASWSGGGLTAGEVTAITSGFSANSDSWDYSVANSALDFLAAGETVTLSFDVTVIDDSGALNDSDTKTVTLTLTGSNDAPVVTGAVLATVDEDDSDPATVSLLANASDPDRTDDVDSASVSYAVTSGTWVPAVVYSVDNESGALTFDPNQFNALGVAESLELTFSYDVVDGNGGVTPTTAVVTITGSNDAPVVTGAVLATVDEDDSDPATVSLLANASDPDRTDDVDSASVSYAVTSGTWVPAVVYSVDNESGALTFDPNQFNALGVAESLELTFSYDVVDGNGGVTPTTAVVTITGSNDAPVVTGAVLATVDEDDSDPATVSLLANASDPDRTDDVDSASVSYAVTSGTWVPAVVYSVDNESGALTFDPNQFNALGVAESLELTFSYDVVDGNGGVTPTTAVVTITGSNDAPVVTGAVLATVDEDDSDPATVSLLANASDPDRTDDVDSASVSYAVTSGTWVPAVVYSVDNESGALTFDPNQFNALGVAESLELTFSYDVVDGNGGVTPTTAVVTITGSNDAPVVNAAATPILAAVAEDAGAPVGAVGTLVSALVNLNPPPGGLDNVTDADSGALTGIAITDTNDSNGTWWFSTNNGASWTQVGSVSDASALLLAADANTRVYFQGDSNFNGIVSDGITFRAWDQTSGTAGTIANTIPNGGSAAFSTATDTADITVSAVNDNPGATGDILYVSNNTVVTLPTSVLLGNDTDIDGAALSVTAISVVAGTLASAVTINPNGTFSFTTGATGGTVASPTVVTMSYTLSDGAGGTATGTITLNVVAVDTGGGNVDTISLGAVGNYQGAYISSGAGADTLTDGGATSVLVGGAQGDTLNGNSGSDVLQGGAQNDNLNGGAGDDVLQGGANNDTMDGGLGVDLLDFSDAAGNFSFTLAAGGTGLTSLLGNDDYSNMEGVIGNAGNNSLSGNAGDNVIRGGAGNDTIDGAGGTADLIDFSDGTAGLTFTLVNNGAGTVFNAGAAGLGTDTYSGIEGVIGTGFSDTLTGSTSADQLRGAGGNDVISGLAGDDRIVGGAGADTLTGGADNDTFVFDSAPNAVDSITDFDASETALSQDDIELSLAIFTGLTTSAGNTLSASEFASSDGGGAADSVGAGVRVIYDSATGNLYYDSDGGSSANRTLVADVNLTNPSDTFDYNDIKVGT